MEGGEQGTERMKVCPVCVPAPHDEWNHCVLIKIKQKKARGQKRKMWQEWGSQVCLSDLVICFLKIMKIMKSETVMD